jgi:hypothetical protein
MKYVTNVALEVHSAILSVLLVIVRVGNYFLQNIVLNMQYQKMLRYMQGVKFVFAQPTSLQMMRKLTFVTDVRSVV